MTTAQWVLGFHLLGAFLFVSGAVAVGVLHAAATRNERPSEIAFLLGLARVAVLLVAVGSLLALGFGAWLVDRDAFSVADAWIAASLALWVVSVVLGAVGGRSARHARRLAERLAADGDEPSPQLRRALLAPAALGLNYASFLALVGILALMVWRPGA